MSYIRNAEVTRKEEKSWYHVSQWTGARIRQEYLEQNENAIHGMLWYIGPSWVLRPERRWRSEYRPKDNSYYDRKYGDSGVQEDMQEL